MAWEKRLLDASFRGVTFDCQLWDDDAERHAVEHLRPFVDGADMGGGATGLASLETGRRFVGVELSEEYYKIASARLVSPTD